MGSLFSGLQNMVINPMDIVNNPKKVIVQALAPHSFAPGLDGPVSKIEDGIFGYSPRKNFMGTAKEEFVGDPNGNDFLGTTDPRALEGTQEEKTSSKKIKRASGPDRRRVGKSSNIFNLLDEDDYSATILGSK
jgi:hypothetical protein